MKCFYHLDNDGKCAGYWVRKICEHNHFPFTEKDFIKMNYNIEFPFNIIQEDERVYIVDYSITPVEMAKLLKITANVIWIDHHSSAISKYSGWNYSEFGNIRGIRDIRYSGAALTWWWYAYEVGIFSRKSENSSLDKEISSKCPYVTRLVDDHDCWKHNMSESMPFKEGLEMEEHNEPYDEVWDKLNTLDVKEYSRILKNGKIALKYRDSMAKYALEMTGKEYEFEGLKCFTMNIPFKGSPWFMDKINEYDAVITYYFNSNTSTWEYSIYTVKGHINVSTIAQKYNGGGHPKAAGFFTKECLFAK